MTDLALTSDRALVGAFLEGSEPAFRELYRRHTPRLRALVLRLLGRAGDESEDVVQDTWLRACGALDRFRWESALSSWLCGIGVRVALEILRRGSRWTAEPLEALETAAPSPATTGWSPPASGEGIDLERALAALPPRQRSVVVLHDIEGYTHEEIGELLGIVAGTSKSQLAHAREALRAALV